LSAGELVLPTIGSDGSISSGITGDGGKKAQGLLKQVYAAAGSWIGDSSQALGWNGGGGGGGYNRYR